MRTISGQHLLIDGYVSDEKSLHPETIIPMFDALVECLGMQYLQRPMAFYVPVDPGKIESSHDDGGWSVSCQITTSHISIHTWPARKAFMMDVFSCRDFESNTAKCCIDNMLGVSHAVTKLVSRSGPNLDLTERVPIDANH